MQYRVFCVGQAAFIQGDGGTTPYGFDKCIQFPLFTKSLISSIEVDDGTSTLRSKETSRMAARSNEARTKEKEGKKANLK